MLTVVGLLLSIFIGSLPDVLIWDVILGEMTTLGQLVRGLGITILAIRLIYEFRQYLGGQSWDGLGIHWRWTAIPQAIAGVLLGLIVALLASWGTVMLGAGDWLAWNQIAPNLAVSALLLAFLAALLVEGLPEELWFRGHLYDTLSRTYSPLMVLLLTSVVFGALHFFSQPPEGIVERSLWVVMATAYGSVLGAGRLVTGLLWLPTGLHAGRNLFAGMFISVEDGMFSVFIVVSAAVMALIGAILLLFGRLLRINPSLEPARRPRP